MESWAPTPTPTPTPTLQHLFNEIVFEIEELEYVSEGLAYVSG